MPLMFVFVVGVGVALLRRRLLAIADDQPRRDDAPARLLGWAVGLLAGQQAEWGQAMIGELDRLDGRSRRWRFALGCVGAALVLPPWGPAAAALGALMSVAAGGAAIAVYTQIHYRLGVGAGTWVLAAILLVVLVGYMLSGGALLRRPGVAAPGLVGGLIVAAAWLAVSGFTLSRFLAPTGFGPTMVALLVVPALVGVGATLWGGGADVGRRAARLAAVSAGLGLYLYGVLAVAVLGAGGVVERPDSWTDADAIGDMLGNQITFYLLAMPLATATIGWAAAAATARLRYGRPTPALATPILSTQDSDRPPTGCHLATGSRRYRTWYRLVLLAGLAAAGLLLLLTFLGPR
jgi:hypothetical protein